MKKKTLKTSDLTKAIMDKLHEMADMGVSDMLIAEKLNIGVALVSKLTTNYWKRKMKDKE